MYRGHGFVRLKDGEAGFPVSSRRSFGSAFSYTPEANFLTERFYGFYNALSLYGMGYIDRIGAASYTDKHKNEESQRHAEMLAQATGKPVLE